MSATDHSREITALIRKLRAEFGACGEHVVPDEVIDPAEPVLCEFIRSMMIWESTCVKATGVMKRLAEAVVDFNELRVCLPDELVRIMGERYPRVEERALRLRASLSELYSRQHAVTLEHLVGMSKRESKEFLDTLDGVPRFVTARVSLLRLGVHAAPVDGRVLKRLAEANIVEPTATPEAAAGVLERGVRAGELEEIYRLLQAWSDQAPGAYSETPPPAAADAVRSRREAKSPLTTVAVGQDPTKKRATPGKTVPKRKSATE